MKWKKVLSLTLSLSMIAGAAYYTAPTAETAKASDTENVDSTYQEPWSSGGRDSPVDIQSKRQY
ncbi:MAG: hypothetical protein HFI79_06565 [Lachnospiraceae bacterium]|nr:hypothetical protein [Lachnospiraceae bacterium]